MPVETAFRNCFGYQIMCRLVLAVAGLLVIGRHCNAADSPAPRPNVVMILIDDLRWDELGCAGHPYVKTPGVDRLAAEGWFFENAFTVAPLCSPSRASFLTANYPQRHGIVDNVDRSALSHQLVTWPRILHDSGYETGWVGKWHMGVDDSPRPGFDDWLSVKGQGRYENPQLNDNGRAVQGKGYVTDIFTDRAVAFLKKPREKPFCLYLSHKAVHPDLEQRADGSIVNALATNFVPAKRHARLYEGVTIPRRPNCDDTLEGKPALQRKIEGLPPLGKRTATKDHEILGRQRMFAAVDEGIGRILATLDELGKAGDTIVAFTSDHGYFYGEHGLSYERRLAYEEAIRIPLIVRYPALLRPGHREKSAVLSIDVGPALLELCGASFSGPVDGRSFAPLLRGESQPPRYPFLVQHSSDAVFARMRGIGYDAVRGERYKFIRYRDLQGMNEIYDLHADPYELRNLIHDPQIAEIHGQMERELERIKK
jgi:N-acetylglucosamine-6-sulfatase